MLRKIVSDDQARRRLKRKLKGHQKDATETAVQMGQQADDNIERLLIRRFGRLAAVRRFVFLWSLLFVLLFFSTLFQMRGLSKYYQALEPVPGGLYNEGVIGTFTNADPLYATGTADTAISHLIFSGLFKYDDNNKLTGDLALSWQAGTSSSQYIVKLRHGVKWQDGMPFTADDVVFTYKTIQNIEAQSSLYSSWQGITVSKVDNYTVRFDLPNPLSAFPYSLTNGIVPQHLLRNIQAEDLRSASFNTQPVGTGPFVWKYVNVSGDNLSDRQQRISLAAYKDYHFGKPKLDGFNLVTFSDDQHLTEAFEKKQLNAMSGLESLPTALVGDDSVHVYVTPLTSAVMTFFNNSRPVFADAKVRQALVSGVDRSSISQLGSYPVQVVNSPLLKSQLGYDPAITQLPFNEDYANQLLDQAGWTRGAGGVRYKDGQPLSFTLVTQDTAEYSRVASFLQSQWQKLGVKVSVQYYSGSDLQTQVISSHGYDALLYGISLGVDPDVFAYWDSSQASLTSQGHLNLSEYKSSTADQALEFGRTRSDPNLRAIKYQAFLTSWKNDAPALAMYQPNFIYITRGPVYNYERKAANTPEDRFYNVNEWMIRQKRQNVR